MDNPVSTVVDFSPVIQGLVSLLILVAIALMTFCVNWVRSKIGLEKMSKDDMFRKYLEDTLAHAIRYAASKVPASVDVGRDNLLAATAVKYILATVPDALKHFGLTEEAVLNMVESRLQGALNPAQPLQPVSNSTVVDPNRVT